MPYAPGVVDRSGEIRAQGMLQGGIGVLGGIEKGIERWQQNKEKDKQANALLKANASVLEALGGISKDLGPEFGTAISQLLEKTNDPSLSTIQKAQLSQQGLAGIKDLLNTGVEMKKQQQLAQHQAVIRDIQLKRLAAGPAQTEAQRNTELILQSRIAAGEIDPNDPVAISKERAKLMSLGGRDERTGQPYQSLGPAQDAGGNYVGERMFDQRTGEVVIVKPKTGGEKKQAEAPAPAQGAATAPVEGVRPATASGLNKAVLNANDFLKLRAQVTDDEISLGRFSRYIENVDNAAQGIETIADRFATAYKTFTDSGQLTPAQVAQARANGQLQGLIGQSRLEVLGGGVLTEQDAVRIIDYLGGDSGALRNKELVKKAISDIYQDKYKRYSRGLEDYNTQVKNYYGGQGYKPVESAQYDERMFVANAPAAAKPEDELSQLDKEMAAIKQRIEKLRGSKK